MRYLAFSVLLFIISLLFNLSSFAARYYLYESPGVPVSDYTQIVDELMPGDELVFSNGQLFTVGGYLREGNTTKVIAVSDQHVLRIPLKVGLFKNMGTYHDLMSSYATAYTQFKETDLPIPRVFLEESLEKEYLLVERVKIKYTLDFFLNKVNDRTFSADMQATGFTALVEFFRKTWQFNYIGDFHHGQIGWNGESWILLDYLDREISVAHAVESPMDLLFQIDFPFDWDGVFKNAIRDERAKHLPQKLPYQRSFMDRCADLLHIRRHHSTAEVPGMGKLFKWLDKDSGKK